MKLKYIFTHGLVHVLLALSIAYVFQLNYLGYLIVLIASFIIDIDHLSLLKKYGIRGYFHLRAGKEFRKPRKYFLHTLYVLATTGILFSIFFYFQFLFLTVVFLAIFLHLLWDLLEDKTIFNLRINHWR